MVQEKINFNVTIAPIVGNTETARKSVSDVTTLLTIGPLLRLMYSKIYPNGALVSLCSHPFLALFPLVRGKRERGSTPAPAGATKGEAKQEPPNGNETVALYVPPFRCPASPSRSKSGNHYVVGSRLRRATRGSRTKSKVLAHQNRRGKKPCEVFTPPLSRAL